ncbi:MAG: nucleoside 2-deoxyribosyltransferase [Nitrososphaerota archaeon]|jgi:nucleoside 2-deoxyribosyltransferase|nr:nucleoside 2-deoxyribosyltransferase [Nitrososphaerota archaeon]
MKVYLSVPMIANRELQRAKDMARAIADAGHSITSPWVLGPIEKRDGSPVNIFRRDMEAAEASDVLVADVTDPSVGVGMEIMAAHKAGKRIILVTKKGKVISGMLVHMDGKEFVEYDSEEEIYPILLRAL